MSSLIIAAALYCYGWLIIAVGINVFIVFVAYGIIFVVSSVNSRSESCDIIS